MSLFSHSIGAKDNFCRDADRIAGLSLKSNKDDAVFTTKISTPIIHTSQIMSQSSHLKIGSKDTNDFNIFLNNAETLQLTRSGTEVRYQSNGGTGKHRFMNDVEFNGDINLASGKEVKINGTNILSTIQSNITTLQNTDTAIQSSLNAKANTSALGDYATLVDLGDADASLQSSIALKQNLLNTSDFFLVENEPKVGLGTSNPVSAAGSDSFLQIFGQTDCGLSLKRGGGGNWEFKVKNPTGNMGIYNGGSERGNWSDTELMVKQGLKVVGSVINFSNIPTSATGLSSGDIYSNSGVLTIIA